MTFTTTGTSIGSIEATLASMNAQVALINAGIDDDPDDHYEDDEDSGYDSPHDDGWTEPHVHQKPCIVCKATPNKLKAGHHSATYVFDGERIIASICAGCYNGLECNMYFCVGCEDFYVAPDDWCSSSSFSIIPCPKHSISKVKPWGKCSSCTKKQKKFFNNMRGINFCEACWFDTTTCGAPYCSVVIHQNQEGVVYDNMKKQHYCGDCALVTTSPHAIIVGFHPLTWEYNAECWCAACTHLAGKGPRWPSVDKDEPDSQCDSCHVAVGSSTLYKPEGTKDKYCHICTTHLKKCNLCKTQRLTDQFHKAITMHHSADLYGACDFCIKDNTNMWLCDATCQLWLPKASGCVCGGVLPYDYTPKVTVFMCSRSQQRVAAMLQDKTPFLGLELEMEAQHKPATRKKGAKLLKKIASEYGYVVHDGTLLGTNDDGLGGQKGFEFVTHPFTYDWFNDNWSQIEKMLDTMTKAGFRSWEGGRCGLHVHISRGPMSDAHQMKFIRFIYGSVNMVMCVGQRGYRDPILNQFSPFHREDRARFMMKIRQFTNPDVHGHYAALNCNKPATLEGRWFRGTLNPLGVRKNVEFMHSLWHFTKMYGFSSANEINYIDWLRQTPQSKEYAVLLKFLEREYVTRR